MELLGHITCSGATYLKNIILSNIHMSHNLAQISLADICLLNFMDEIQIPLTSYAHTIRKPVNTEKSNSNYIIVALALIPPI